MHLAWINKSSSTENSHFHTRYMNIGIKQQKEAVITSIFGKVEIESSTFVSVSGGHTYRVV